MKLVFQLGCKLVVRMASLELLSPSNNCACMLLRCLLMHLQYGQSSFYKLPGGKLKPDEDGEWAGVIDRGRVLGLGLGAGSLQAHGGPC
jgi:hypothetical protein